MAIFKLDDIVRMSDIGYGNRLSNKAIIKKLCDVACIHSDEAGTGISQIPENHLSWIVFNWKVEVLERPFFNEKIHIETWGRDNSKITTYRDYEIYNEAGKLLVRASSKWGLIDIRTGRLQKITDDIIENYHQEKDKVAFEGLRELDKISEPEEHDSKLEYIIRRNFIDLNNHVNNLYYLDIAYECLPEELYNREEFKNIEILYKKQMKLGDKINCYYTHKEDGEYITLKSEDDSILHSIVKLY